jgi:hypothetical protein
MGNRSPVEEVDQDGLLAVMDRVRQIAADLFAVPVDGLTEESSPDSIGSWDSLNHLNLGHSVLARGDGGVTLDGADCADGGG